MQSCLVDTDVLIDYLHGRQAAVEYIDGLSTALFLSVITVAELYAGVREGAERVRLDKFVSTFDSIYVDTEIAVQGGLYHRTYGRSHGTGIADSLIAATAALGGLSLVTLNHRHFPMLTNVIVPY
ncbi:MAG: type II toxin-antitoxin system VapC family toxin [Anaerolineae bacterium]